MRYGIKELIVGISLFLKISVEKMEFFGFIKSICSNNKRKNASATATYDVNTQNFHLLPELIIARRRKKEKRWKKNGRKGEVMLDIIFFIILIVSAIIGNVVIKKIDHEKSMIYLTWSIFICLLGCALLYFRLM